MCDLFACWLLAMSCILFCVRVCRASDTPHGIPRILVHKWHWWCSTLTIFRLLLLLLFIIRVLRFSCILLRFQPSRNNIFSCHASFFLITQSHTHIYNSRQFISNVHRSDYTYYINNSVVHTMHTVGHMWKIFSFFLYIQYTQVGVCRSACFVLCVFVTW